MAWKYKNFHLKEKSNKHHCVKNVIWIFCRTYFLSKQNFYAVDDKFNVFYSVDE